MSDKIKCVFYGRVSTKSDDQLNSFENQEKFFHDFISKNSDKYEIYKSASNNNTGIYADKGISGTLLHRENFEKMLWDCGLDVQQFEYEVHSKTDVDGKTYAVEYKDYLVKHNENATNPAFEEIIVKSTSRFARNIMVNDILRKLSANGVYVRFLDINQSTRNPEDIMIIQFFQQFDEMFSRDLSRKLLAANKQSAEKQILRSNSKLYGYKYISRRNTKKENNYLKIIDDEAYIIQMIFRLYLGCFKVEDNEAPRDMIKCNFSCSNCSIYKELISTDGLGFRNIVDTLNNVYNFRTRKGKKFKQTTIKNILNNEKYAGFLNNRKNDHGTVFETRSSPRIRENYDLVYRPDLIDEIISKELFDLCIEKKKIKAGDTSGVFKGKSSKYKGLLRCGNCGEVYTHNKSNDNKGFYNCKTKKQDGIKACNNINVFDSVLEEKINELAKGDLNNLITSENIQVISVLIKEIEDKLDFILRNRDTDEIHSLSKEISLSKKGLKRLITERAMSDYPEIHDELIEEFKEKLDAYTTKYEKLSKKPLTYINECSILLSTCKEIISSSENMKNRYSEKEVLSHIQHFTVYGEPEKVNGVWQSPKPIIIPVLKTTATAKKLTPLNVNLFTVKDLGFDLGFNKNELDETKKYLFDLEKKINKISKSFE